MDAHLRALDLSLQEVCVWGDSEHRAMRKTRVSNRQKVMDNWDGRPGKRTAL